MQKKIKPKITSAPKRHTISPFANDEVAALWRYFLQLNIESNIIKSQTREILSNKHPVSNMENTHRSRILQLS